MSGTDALITHTTGRGSHRQCPRFEDCCFIPVTTQIRLCAREVFEAYRFVEVLSTLGSDEHCDPSLDLNQVDCRTSGGDSSEGCTRFLDPGFMNLHSWRGHY
jgi:hypothetical protein